MKRIETVDIIKGLITNQLTFDLVVSSVEVIDSNTFKIFVCETHYLSGKLSNNAQTIEIDNNTYEVLEVVDNESVTLQGSVLLSIGTYQLPSIYFKHGTIFQTNIELSAVIDKNEITPLVYLKRTFRETINGPENAIDRESDITLYFLTQANFNEWETENYDEYAIVPMRNAVYSFIEMLQNNKYIGKIKDYQVTDIFRFATYSDKGAEKLLFNEHLSGVELTLTLPINKNFKCKC
jgi:hypothetical protein